MVSSIAHAGAAYKLYRSPTLPGVEVCRDKTGMFITVPNHLMEEMIRITLDHYESLDGKIHVERHSKVLELINDQGERHLLEDAGGGFGACGFPF